MERYMDVRVLRYRGVVVMEGVLKVVKYTGSIFSSPSYRISRLYMEGLDRWATDQTLGRTIDSTE
jgi:hypothetical protein